MTNPQITIIDDLSPEDNAMLQALQSRSPALVADRLATLQRSGSGPFMDQYYVGYNHKSIGDCGTTTIYLEGVTMLCAKAIQDWPLYNGQEASTRYMDFSDAVFHNPLGTQAGEDIQERWRAFYLAAQQPLRAHLYAQYPRLPEDKESEYERAISARSFDILRAFLPAGASTNLSWHTNLRQAYDNLRWVRCHPDPSIAAEGARLLAQLQAKYPHSFNFRDETSGWRRDVMAHHHILRPSDIGVNLWEDDTVSLRTTVFGIHDRDLGILCSRPRGEEIPRYFQEFGDIRSEFTLDFGSYRDLQRHRNGTMRMPLLTTEIGFHGWYLDQLPRSLRGEAEALIREQWISIYHDTDECPFSAQSYIAMGFKVPCRVTQGLPAFVYRVELRSSKTVHPTLRRIVIEEISRFRTLFPSIPLFVDEDRDSWTVRRGRQTITEKTSDG